MLDITDCDIAELNDTDLRALVAMLVEATLRGRGIPTSAVTWGGDQNAPDGGVDVRVELEAGATTGGFIPRMSIGFQVKKPDMGPADINREMRPDGSLREAICNLADRSGAYIIASSGSKLSDAALARRRVAMRAAVADHANGSALAVDFYDRQRLATWARDFPGLCPWVLERVGRPIQGWRPFGDWAASGAGVAAGYIADDFARLFAGSAKAGGMETGVPILAGLQQMRAVVARPGSSLRLIGLSGVGKTRLVQALFEDAVGTASLDPSQAIYTDLAHHPDPTPTAVATYLKQRCARSIVIVDNCPAALHRQLTQLCSLPGSTVSVVTVEYDIRDDMPEATDVFRLQDASDDVVTKLVAVRCPWLSQVDAQTIGVFSGGNARVGLALAQTVLHGESLSGLSDDDLFSRLFSQRHANDKSLLASAEACALVYSFDGEIAGDGDCEMSRIAAVAGCTPALLHGHVAELERRGLVQRRGRWRAVLPHAMANRLAERALENFPLFQLNGKLVDRAPERLIESYSRRLGYLHKSRVAVGIVDGWLSASGLLGAHVGNLNRLGMAMFSNVAPVQPEAALQAVERVRDDALASSFFSTENLNRDEFVHLIRKVAFDADLFERCAELLVRFATAPDAAETEKDTRLLGIWRSLFSPFLSGTHAPVERRMQVLDSLLRSGCQRKHGLAVNALASALETFHFSSVDSFDFGAQPRDYGYHPEGAEEQKRWYSAGIQLATQVGASTAASAPAIRQMFADKIPGLWMHTATRDLIVTTVEKFSKGVFWVEGLLGVREAIWRMRDHPGEGINRLRDLERRLSPQSLAEEIHMHVIRDKDWLLDSENTPEAVMAATNRADAHAEHLGFRAAAEPVLFSKLLPDLIAAGSGRRWHFARGLARGAAELEGYWSKLVDAVSAIPTGANPTVLFGYLSGWNGIDPTAARAMVDQSISDPRLVELVPQLEIAIGFDELSIARLQRALDAGATARAFWSLSGGRLTDAIPSPDLSGFLNSLAAAEDGWPVAIDILAMRLGTDNGTQDDLGSLIDLGRTLLPRIDPPSQAHRRLDHDLSIVAAACLSGPEGEQAAFSVCTALGSAYAARAIAFHEFKEFLKAIFRTQPIVALNVFLGPSQSHTQQYPTILGQFSEVSGFFRSPIYDVGDDVILHWCNLDPAYNFPAGATSVPFSRTAPNGVGLVWTDLASAMLDRAPDPRAVLVSFVARFTPSAWSGSRAAITEANAELLIHLERSTNADLADLARSERQRLLDHCRRERICERERSRHDDERFE